MRVFSNFHRGETVAGESQQRRRSLPGVSSAHLLKLVEDRDHTGFWTLDFATHQLTLSAGLDHLFGIDAAIRFEWEDLTRLIHPDDQAAQHGLEAILRSGQPVDGEFRIVRPDRTVRWLQYKAEVIIGADSLPSRAVGLMTDVTHHHAARKAAEEGWLRYEALVTAMASIEFTASAAGDIAFARGWHDLTGQTSAEAAGGGWLGPVHPDDRETARSSWSMSIASRAAYAADLRIRLANGHYRMFMARAAPLLNRDGSVRQWLGALVGTASLEAGARNRPDRGACDVKAAHIRAARALLSWTIHDLARHANISVSSVRRLESEDEKSVRGYLRDRVREAFDARGIIFTAGEDDEVILRLQGHSE